MERLDAVAIGEGQLRLTPAAGTPLAQAHDMRADVAGTEGNVLGILSRLGLRAGLVTALPDHQLGRRIAAEWTQAGIDLTHAIWRPEGRVALYFVDPGSPPVPSRVLYDRRDSCFSRLTADDLDWEYVASARLVHSTGITAALGNGPYGMLERAAQQARAGDQLHSFDVNFRSLLWSADEARERLGPLLQSTDVLFCSRRDAAAVFGINGEAETVPTALADRFGARIVAVSDGADPVHVRTDGRTISAAPPRTTIVDRVGAGDAFVGGFLYGVLSGDIPLGLRLGVAAAALALTRRGDQLHTTLPELTWVIDALESGNDIVR